MTSQRARSGVLPARSRKCLSENEIAGVGRFSPEDPGASTPGALGATSIPRIASIKLPHSKMFAVANTTALTARAKAPVKARRAVSAKRVPRRGREEGC